MKQYPVFFDPKNRRAAHLSRVGWTLAVMSTVAGVVFLSSLLLFRTFPESLTDAPAPRYAVLNDVAKNPHLLPSVRNLARAAQAHKKNYPPSRHPLNMAAARAKGMRAPVVKPAPADRREKPLTIGFYANWDDGAYASLRNNIQHLDWVVANWLYLLGDEMELEVKLDEKALELIRHRKPGATILAMIQNSTKIEWDGAGLARLLADPAKEESAHRWHCKIRRNQRFAGRYRRLRAVPGHGP